MINFLNQTRISSEINKMHFADFIDKLYYITYIIKYIYNCNIHIISNKEYNAKNQLSSFTKNFVFSTHYFGSSCWSLFLLIHYIWRITMISICESSHVTIIREIASYWASLSFVWPALVFSGDAKLKLKLWLAHLRVTRSGPIIPTVDLD